MTFHVGQKVVCVDASPRRYLACELVKGRVYTISGHTTLGVFVQEARGYGAYGDFWPDRFRPVVERKTSIEIFTAMLTPSDTPRVPANVEAV